jgi:hypothetical protein
MVLPFSARPAIDHLVSAAWWRSSSNTYYALFWGCALVKIDQFAAAQTRMM